MKVDVVTDKEQFALLAEQWNDLPQARQSPLLRHEWFSAATETFSKDDQLSIFVARDGDAVRAIAPLVLDHRLGLKRLNILGHHAQEPNAFLYSDIEALSAVCAEVRRVGFPAAFPRLAVGSAELRLLREGQVRGTSKTRGAPMHNARVNLSTWDALLEGMTSSSKATIRRKRRLAERSGVVASEAIVPTESDLPQLLDEVFRIEAAGWKSRAGTSILSDPAMREFYTVYAHKAACLGFLRIYFLRVGGHAIATRLAVSFAGRLWELKIGYDEEWKNCSPGLLLTHDTLRFACEEGLFAHEFLGLAESWQRSWPVVTSENTSVRFYPYSVQGGLSLAADAYQVGGKRVRAFLEVARSRFQASKPVINGASSALNPRQPTLPIAKTLDTAKTIARNQNTQLRSRVNHEWWDRGFQIMGSFLATQALGGPVASSRNETKQRKTSHLGGRE